MKNLFGKNNFTMLLLYTKNLHAENALKEYLDQLQQYPESKKNSKSKQSSPDHFL